MAQDSQCKDWGKGHGVDDISQRYRLAAVCGRACHGGPLKSNVKLATWEG